MRERGGKHHKCHQAPHYDSANHFHLYVSKFLFVTSGWK
jgi:hypothetical protein